MSFVRRSIIHVQILEVPLLEVILYALGHDNIRFIVNFTSFIPGTN